MTHDRVLRFEPVFDTPRDAAAYATGRALAWLGDRPAALAAATASSGA